MLINVLTPSQERYCCFCDNSSVSRPNVSIFNITKDIQKTFKSCHLASNFICAEHFKTDDLYVHGKVKRLRKGAIPVVFPCQQASSVDQRYVKIGPLNLVNSLLIYQILQRKIADLDR